MPVCNSVEIVTTFLPRKFDCRSENEFIRLFANFMLKISRREISYLKWDVLFRGIHESTQVNYWNKQRGLRWEVVVRFSHDLMMRKRATFVAAKLSVINACCSGNEMLWAQTVFPLFQNSRRQLKKIPGAVLPNRHDFGTKINFCPKIKFLCLVFGKSFIVSRWAWLMQLPLRYRCQPVPSLPPSGCAPSEWQFARPTFWKSTIDQLLERQFWKKFFGGQTSNKKHLERVQWSPIRNCCSSAKNWSCQVFDAFREKKHTQGNLQKMPTLVFPSKHHSLPRPELWLHFVETSIPVENYWVWTYPMGWPMLTAPPWMFTLLGSRLHFLMLARTTTLNASFTSNMATSSCFTPACTRHFGIA